MKFKIKNLIKTVALCVYALAFAGTAADAGGKPVKGHGCHYHCKKHDGDKFQHKKNERGDKYSRNDKYARNDKYERKSKYAKKDSGRSESYSSKKSKNNRSKYSSRHNR